MPSATMRFRDFSHSYSLFSDPLFSTAITFFALILVYFPRLIFSRIIFSPVLILTGILLLSLLRLGATQRFERQKNENAATDSDATEITDETRNDAVKSESFSVGHDRPVPQLGTDRADCSPCFEDNFVEWNVRAPLEVIYEEFYEGEEDKDASNENDPYFTESVPYRHADIVRYPSLSLYYPETDSNSSSDDEFPAAGVWDSVDHNKCFVWDDEEKEELIEIALDEKRKASEFQLEEENLIEIDISPTSFPT